MALLGVVAKRRGLKAKVRANRADTELVELRRAFRHGCGTHVPGAFVAGTFYKADERHFGDVRRSERALSIRLEAQRYDQLFIEAEAPEAALQILRGETAVAA